MKRALYAELLKWKKAPGRKPLILRGARQTGKSYLLSEFGRLEFPDVHVFDFEKNGRELLPLFEESLDPQRLVQHLGLYQEKPIGASDLILFDEIQNCPRALTSLKYFCEDLPGQPVCAAGSLLGVAVLESAYPVGKVTHLDLFPMSFEEFLLNSGHDLLLEAFYSSWEQGRTPSIVHTKLWERLKEFYVTGGMPEAVATFFRHGKEQAAGLLAARDVHRELVRSFMQDFAKHSGAVNAAHIAAVFEDVPRQLFGHVDASVKRYRFKHAVPGIRGFAQLEGPIGWLEKAGLVHKVPVCQRAEVPFQAFTKANMFKLFVCDVGLLGSMLGLSPAVLMGQDFGITKGFFAENFVACEWLAAGEQALYSWSERNSEIEFLLAADEEVIPVEVKSGLRTRSQSLRQFRLKYSPRQTVKISGHPLAAGDGSLMHVPLYYAAQIPGWLKNV
jgi:predicted AAA+ superfamily ATPase